MRRRARDRDAADRAIGLDEDLEQDGARETSTARRRRVPERLQEAPSHGGQIATVLGSRRAAPWPARRHSGAAGSAWALAGRTGARRRSTAAALLRPGDDAIAAGPAGIRAGLRGRRARFAASDDVGGGLARRHDGKRRLGLARLFSRRRRRGALSHGLRLRRRRRRDRRRRRRGLPGGVRCRAGLGRVSPGLPCRTRRRALCASTGGRGRAFRRLGRVAFRDRLEVDEKHAGMGFSRDQEKQNREHAAVRDKRAEQRRERWSLNHECSAIQRRTTFVSIGLLSLGSTIPIPSLREVGRL